MLNVLLAPKFIETSYGRLAFRSEGSGSLPAVLRIQANS